MTALKNKIPLLFFFLILVTSTSAPAQKKSLYQLQSEHVDLRFGMFIHFNINTYFPGWGNDRVDPKIFNPTDLDCSQWAKAAKSAGIKYALLTTKHHDGFALWPSKQVPPNGKPPYTIAQSSIPERDVVKEYVDAFRAEGIIPGLYFSMWDAASGIGGPYKETDAIDWPKVKPFIFGQIKELLGGNYGEIPIFVIDGYMWKMGHWQIPIQEIRDLIKTLQPNCLFTDHNGGIPWGVDLVYFEEPLGIVVPDNNTIAACQGQTISKSWFWDESSSDSSRLKSVPDLLAHLKHLEPLYTNFIINCPPNRNGLLDKAITDRLEAVGKNWQPDLTRPPLPPQPPGIEYPATPVAAYATSGNAMFAIDGLNDWQNGPRFQTLWQSDRKLPQALALNLGRIFNNIDIFQYLPRRDNESTGYITAYRILVSNNGKEYSIAAEGIWPPDNSIKTVRLKPQPAKYVKIEILDATGGMAVAGEFLTGSENTRLKY
jgi:alpha-L-fucosidase